MFIPYGRIALTSSFPFSGRRTKGQMEILRCDNLYTGVEFNNNIRSVYFEIYFSESAKLEMRL